VTTTLTRTSLLRIHPGDRRWWSRSASSCPTRGQAATSSLVPRSGTFRAVHGMARGRSASHDHLPPGGIRAGVDSGHGRRL